MPNFHRGKKNGTGSESNVEKRGRVERSLVTTGRMATLNLPAVGDELVTQDDDKHIEVRISQTKCVCVCVTHNTHQVEQ